MVGGAVVSNINMYIAFFVHNDTNIYHFVNMARKTIPAEISSFVSI
jgi:hypothetical protein